MRDYQIDGQSDGQIDGESGWQIGWLSSGLAGWAISRELERIAERRAQAIPCAGPRDPCLKQPQHGPAQIYRLHTHGRMQS